MKNLSCPYLICELANSHGGECEAIHELVDVFGQLDHPSKAIKFQVFAADTIALPDFSWHSVYKQLEIEACEWKQLIAKAAIHGDVWIDVFDRYSTEIIAENLDVITGIKLQASVLENDEVLGELRKLDLSDLSLVLNISGFELSEIHRIFNRFRSLTASIILQIGFQAYPTALADTALQKLAVLHSAFPSVALSIADHADATSDFAQLVPLYAHILGCDYIEKHLCLDRAQAKYDAFSALEPGQMQLLCSRLQALAAANSGPFVNEAERNYLARSLQIPVLRHELSIGARIEPSDLLFRRTAQRGISWYQIDELQRNRKLLASHKSARSALLISDFKPARVAAIVACRMKSSRLPRKALLPITNRPSVEICLNQCQAISGIDEVILATSTLLEDAILENYCCNGTAKFWTGDPDDVIARYLGACKQHSIDIVVRITADCPLVSPKIVEKLLDAHFELGADYTAAASAAVGTTAEIISTTALQKVIDLIGHANHSEYMTWYFRNNPHLFKLNIVDLPDELVRGYRLTLDYQEDLEFFEALLKRLPPDAASYALSDIFDVLDNAPEVVALNSTIPLKYQTDRKLIDMLNEKTRIQE